jgi:hypothetical protein
MRTYKISFFLNWKRLPILKMQGTKDIGYFYGLFSVVVKGNMLRNKHGTAVLSLETLISFAFLPQE